MLPSVKSGRSLSISLDISKDLKKLGNPVINHPQLFAETADHVNQEFDRKREGVPGNSCPIRPFGSAFGPA
jgi:hypothetical protein